LHAKDVQGLMLVLQQLADAGHALVMIEHDPSALSACDRLVELGPGGGKAGGEVVAEGSAVELRDCADSPTGPWLAGGRTREKAQGCLKKKGRPKKKGRSKKSTSSGTRRKAGSSTS
jgi:excinuclease ABC subunit A